MKRRSKIKEKRLALIFAFVVFSSIACSAQENQIIPAPEVLGSVKKKLSDMVEVNEIPSISVAVAKNGEIIWLESFGYADIENKIKATPNTIYALGSLSKSISATAVMTLVDAGKLNLEDRVNNLIAPLRLQSHTWNTDEVELWQLLNMSAGLPHGWITRRIENRTEYNKNEFFEEYGQIMLPPGKINHYSNFSWGVTEQVIVKATGQSLTKYLDSAVFKPLNMMGSLVQYDESRSEEIAKQYTSKRNLIAPYDFYPLNSAGYFSSATDLLKYGMFYLQNDGAKRILKRETIDLMHNFDKGPEGVFRLGWGKLGNLLITNGGIPGANSCLILVPSEDLVVICLTNYTSNNSITDQIAFEMVGKLAPNALDMSAMAEFEKTFRTPYIPTEKLVGEWVGKIESTKRIISTTINFNTDGKVSIQIGENEPKNLESIIFNKVDILEGSFKGIVPVDKYDPGKEVPINLTLHLNEDQLSGYLAPSFRNNRGSFSFAVPLVLRKK